MKYDSTVPCHIENLRWKCQMNTIDVLTEIGQRNVARIKEFCFCLVDYSHDEDELSGLER